MHAPRPPHRRARRGSYALEFALTLPMWLFMLTLIMEFGWLFLHQATLDAAANLGCRAGSLIDPGLGDSNIAAVEAAATRRMLRFVEDLGTEVCDECAVKARTLGMPPQRTLECRATWEVPALTGLVFDERTMVSFQLARLEWQRSPVVP